MLHVTAGISLDERELTFSFTRSGGPGGQNVNKLATAVQLRFDVRCSSALPHAVKERLLALAGSRVTDQGVLIIDAREHRSQVLNREAAVRRLVALVRKAAAAPRRRRKTKPTRASQEQRVEGKRRRSSIKQLRGKLGDA